ncbi:MAG: hypothetical protein H8F28_12445 [Fibrella sp.]|nr:hypothetical protein [Armatimonadota bacterium]
MTSLSSPVPPLPGFTCGSDIDASNPWYPGAVTVSVDARHMPFLTALTGHAPERSAFRYGSLEITEDSITLAGYGIKPTERFVMIGILCIVFMFAYPWLMHLAGINHIPDVAVAGGGCGVALFVLSPILNAHIQHRMTFDIPWEQMTSLEVSKDERWAILSYIEPPKNPNPDPIAYCIPLRFEQPTKARRFVQIWDSHARNTARTKAPLYSWSAWKTAAVVALILLAGVMTSIFLSSL